MNNSYLARRGDKIIWHEGKVKRHGIVVKWLALTGKRGDVKFHFLVNVIYPRMSRVMYDREFKIVAHTRYVKRQQPISCMAPIRRTNCLDAPAASLLQVAGEAHNTPM